MLTDFRGREKGKDGGGGGEREKHQLAASPCAQMGPRHVP